MARDRFEQDTVKTTDGDLQITFVGHGSLMFSMGGRIIHIDPVSDEADYRRIPKADLILVTHDHSDHMDAEAIKILTIPGKTVLVMTETCATQLKCDVVLKNGDVKIIDGLKIEAVPAYNIEHKRPDGQPFHSRGVGNGYVITFGDTRVYIAGDTENIPEMRNLQGIDIAFLPMNLPYTMTPDMVAEAVQSFKPRILYPYHFGETNTDRIIALLKGSGTEVRIRSMK